MHGTATQDEEVRYNQFASFDENIFTLNQL